MKGQDLIRQMLNVADTGSVYEWRVTSESGGNAAYGIPTSKTKYKYKLLSSHIIKKLREEWITTGIAQLGDVALITAEEITMSNQVEHDGVTYDIVEKIDAATYSGTYYLYILRKVLG